MQNNGQMRSRLPLPKSTFKACSSSSSASVLVSTSSSVHPLRPHPYVCTPMRPTLMKLDPMGSALRPTLMQLDPMGSVPRPLTTTTHTLNDSQLEEYRLRCQQLEAENQRLKTTLNDDNNNNNKLVDEYRQQIRQLEDQLAHQKTVKASLEEKTLKDSQKSKITSKPDDNDINNYRIIHLKQNPLSMTIAERNEEFRRLVDENERLEQRLQLLESGSDADITRQIDEGIKYSQELDKLKKQLTSAEKRQQNIIDAFKKTSKEFREVCYRLTGFKIDMLKQNKYRLTHMYADSPDDELLFECDTDRTIKIMENQYSDKLQESVNTYLTAHDSYPAFLASLTLDLFHKQTIV
ncbi:mitotic spindle assembly checkpoint protein MAD1-like [Oppia nitens]|uniref:mitotic spindle assembly checkpoint protein MAD1-like n=1 Tax=Oppia nitens TaxID=1686743 RepID=UPI0023DC215C|nr:mitotic spindle assembly checkpoint protein MAD1-like [Oppia nitens]